MRQPKETTLWGQAQRRILDGVFLPSPESQTKEYRVKTPMSKNRSLKTVALPVKMKNLETLKWKCCESLCDGLGWKYKMGCKNPSDSPRKGEGWRRKAMIWKTSIEVKNNNTTTTNITKTSWWFSRASTIAGSFLSLRKLPKK